MRTPVGMNYPRSHRQGQERHTEKVWDSRKSQRSLAVVASCRANESFHDSGTTKPHAPGAVPARTRPGEGFHQHRACQSPLACPLEEQPRRLRPTYHRVRSETAALEGREGVQSGTAGVSAAESLQCEETGNVSFRRRRGRSSIRADQVKSKPSGIGQDRRIGLIVAVQVVRGVVVVVGVSRCSIIAGVVRAKAPVDLGKALVPAVSVQASGPGVAGGRARLDATAHRRRREACLRACFLTSRRSPCEPRQSQHHDGGDCGTTNDVNPEPCRQGTKLATRCEKDAR